MEVSGYHAHVYYNEESFLQAKELVEQAGEKFEVELGRMHKKPVGPHPVWSCQIAFPPELFGIIVPWLNVNRKGLDVFVHPLTGDDLMDHTELVMWLGRSYALKTEMFSKIERS